MTDGKYIALAIIVVAFLVVGAYLLVNYQKIGGEGKVISVDGISQIKAQPDLVSVYINVETSNSSAQNAKDVNAEIVDKVVTGLIKLGFERKEIQTQNFNIYQDSRWENGEYVTKGWKAVNSIVVKVSQTEKVGQVVDAAVDNGGLINSINFELTPEKENQLKAQALKEAALDAKTKALALAEGSGNKLGDLVDIHEGFDYRPYPIYAADVSGTGNVGAKEAATNISPTDLTITANVQAKYKIK